MAISDSTVAIIGTGNIGTRLAANFAAGGQDFLLAGRDQEAARELAADLDGHAEVVSVDEAVDRAGVLVIAVWLDAFKQLIAQYGERLAGKVIVDPTNPVGASSLSMTSLLSCRENRMEYCCRNVSPRICGRSIIIYPLWRRCRRCRRGISGS